VPYSVQAIEVMIASPSDVPKERQAIRDAVLEWNATHAKDRKQVLLPIGWETHSTPDTGDRPQSIINGQLLKDVDLLIAVFWTRLGSPTGAAPSGTVEEIEKHISAGRSAMLYFSSAPAVPDSIDPEQYSALKVFKQSLKERSLFEEYEDLDGFKSKLRRQLAQKIIQLFPNDGASVQSLAAPPVPPPELSISQKARELLIEASKDPRGTLMRLQMLDGDIVQTNGRNFVRSGDPRSAAEWSRAVSELLEHGFLESRGGKGEVYGVTATGYLAADKLALR